MNVGVTTPDPDLVVCDYDGTLYKTGIQSPSGLNVEKACRKALGELFGPQGFRLFNEIGGLKNRSPGELIEVCLEKGDRELLLATARDRLRRNMERLAVCVPPRKGVPLKWNEGLPLSVAVATEGFVRLKLVILLEEMAGEHNWPEAYPGVVEFFTVAKKKRILSAVLSAGHEFFIRRSYHKTGATAVMPSVMLTDDDLRALPLDANGSYPRKPDPRLFDELLLRWGEHNAGVKKIVRQRMLYVGDDPKRDGELAHKSGVPFAWFNPDDRTADLPPGTIVFRHWSELQARAIVGA